MPDTESLRALIMKRFPMEAWALLWEVADATGAKHSRWADAVAMGLWPSRGLDLHGMEIKASRSDWLRELKKPAKAETICSFCHYWWLVANDRVVNMDELPHTWGLLVPHGGGLKTIKQAPRLKPKPITDVFLAALLRAAAKPGAEVNKKALQAEFWRGQKDERERWERNEKRFEQRFTDLQRTVTEFESHAGFKLMSYSHGAARVGQVVRDVLDGKHNREAEDIRHIRNLATILIENIDESGVLKEVASA